MGIVLGLSIGLAILYGAWFCDRPQSVPKTLIKTAAMLALAVWAWMAGGPAALMAALVLSAVGDAFLAQDGDRWLLPGMAAFFAAHVAYVLLFWALVPEGHAVWQWGAQIALVLGGAAYLFWLSPKLGKMRLPVFAYAAVILMMGAAAILLAPIAWLIMLGALMFIASDAILARELFVRPDHESRATSVILWALYFGGQVLIACGVIGWAI